MFKLIRVFRLFAILTIFISYISFIFFNGSFETHMMMIIFSLGVLQFFKAPPDIGKVFVSLFESFEEIDDDELR